MPVLERSGKIRLGRPSPQAGRRRTEQPILPQFLKSQSLAQYLDWSQTPLASLLFVLPLLILHEIGITWYGQVAGRFVEHRVTAWVLLTRFFDLFGASGRYLPALAVLAVLFAWHAARGDRFCLRPLSLCGMALESALLALPLLLVILAAGTAPPVAPSQGMWQLRAAIYLGAGVYEELVFRLAAIAAFSLILVDMLKIRTIVSVPLVVALAASCFAGYHLLGSEPIGVNSVVLIALRGIYYCVIFLHRGFGICAGVHILYDISILGAGQMSGR